MCDCKCINWIKISEIPNPDYKLKSYLVAGKYPDGKRFSGHALRIDGKWDTADYRTEWLTHYAQFELLPSPDEY